jgi:hypothetical protein
MNKVALLALWLCVAGCGGDGGLSRDEVLNLPPGDATGQALSGEYEVTIATVDCSGQCPSYTVLGFTVHICRPGAVDNERITVTQNGGELTVTGDSSLWVQHLKGGIYQDGHYDIGGYALQGDAVDVTARVRGTISPDGTLTGTAQAKGVGESDGLKINCVGTYDFNGKRE